MMQLRRRTFVLALAVAVTAGIALGGFVTSRAELGRAVPAVTSNVQAPIIPVQMPLTTATLAKVAEVMKPAVININTVGRTGGRTPFEEFFGWVIHGEGGLLGRINATITGTDDIPADASVTLEKLTMFGLGPITVIVRYDDKETTVRGFLLLFLVINLHLFFFILGYQEKKEEERRGCFFPSFFLFAPDGDSHEC